MAEKRIWFQRRFHFDLPLDCHPNVVERLRGTPARLEELVRGIPPSIFRDHPDGSWSLLQNIGHLTDLEELWLGRVEDIARGASTMRPADLQNRRTHEAGHDDRSPEELCREFRAARARLVDAVDPLAEGDFARAALHPRLEKPMRLIDLCVFVAEHDDHHLATITSLARRTA